MPTRLVPTLKWGGILVAVVFAIALVVAGSGETPAEGDVAASAAPTTLYWLLLTLGVVAAIVGFVMEKRQKS